MLMDSLTTDIGLPKSEANVYAQLKTVSPNNILLGNVGDREADRGQDLDVYRLQEVANELEAADKTPHHVAWIARVLDARTQSPSGAGLNLYK